MRRFLQRLVPAKLRNRLFIAFITFILAPVMGYQVYQFNEIQQLMMGELKEKSQQQTDFVKEVLLNLRKEAIDSYYLAESLPKVAGQEGAAAQAQDGVLGEQLRAWLQKRQQISPYSKFITLMLEDGEGNVYHSSDKSQEVRGALSFHKLLEQLPPDKQMVWSKDQQEFITVLESGDQTNKWYFYQRLDYEACLYELTRGFVVHQFYYLLDQAGETVAKTGRMDVLSQPDSYISNEARLIAADLTLASRLPLEQYFGDMDKLRHQSYGVYLVLALLFALITYLIASALIRPLQLLQTRMRQIVDSGFRVSLPVHRFRGEIEDVARSFNQMVDDLQASVQKLKQEERQKEASRFQMLMGQMNPHFLLNTLNTLKWSAARKKDRETADICVALGLLLETSLNVDSDLIHLKEEIRLTDAFLHIQNFRYARRFHIVHEIDEAYHYALVPKLSLQPLVENAIKHGLSHMKEGGIICIRVYREEEQLTAEVEDNGVGLAEAARSKGAVRRSGIGLSNLRERLALMYRGEGTLELQPLPQGTLARMKVPYLLAKPYQEE
ncbi:MAG: helicase Ski2 [Paenibacillaceae bacterium]|jgi:two-component system sensor histidine kinase YesM|nr:helicase Ski2 [Paenibacillaceae bacterium]